MTALYIFKVPTVVSLAQMDKEEEGHFCSPEVPIGDCHGKLVPTIVYPFTEGSSVHKDRSFGALDAATIAHNVRTLCNLQGHKSPMDTPDDTTSDSELSMASSDCSCPERFTHTGQTTLAEKTLMREWNKRSEQGLFRYDVTKCETKLTEGVLSFVTQLNEGRATKKRATEFCVDQVCQPFDGSKFNFRKAAMKEVLFQFVSGPVSRTEFKSTSECGPSPNLVLINVSPIEYGHILLVPRVNDCIPQVVDQTSLLFALQCAMEIHNPYFRLGYNSLGAFGTINHLHFQGYFMEHPYPVERAPTVPVPGLPDKVRGVHVERLAAYPVEGWVFSRADNVDSMASLVGAICMQLQTLNVPHNLLICDMGLRVILWPQCFAEKQAKGLVPDDVLETGVNPAAFEIAGHMVLKRREDYDAMSQQRAWELLSHVSLTLEDITALQDQLFARYMDALVHVSS